MSKIHVTLTINLKDGTEINDLAGNVRDLAHVPEEVEAMLDRANVKEGDWSSLVVVLVAE